MDMYQKRKMRKEKRKANQENNKEFTTSHISCPILPNVKSTVNPYK